jgi:hypothetical protein
LTGLDSPDVDRIVYTKDVRFLEADRSIDSDKIPVLHNLGDLLKLSDGHDMPTEIDRESGMVVSRNHGKRTLP